MMRLLKSVNISDSAHIVRICSQWLKEGLGLRIVDYGIGNPYTGNIDMLATDEKNVHLVSVNTQNNDHIGDTLLGALTAYRWYHESREFLSRVYHPDEIDFTLPVTIIILSPSFPPEFSSILKHSIKVDVRLFQYLILGSEEEPELYVEELGSPVQAICQQTLPKPAELKSELGIEDAGLSDDEIRDFIIAMRA